MVHRGRRENREVVKGRRREVQKLWLSEHEQTGKGIERPCRMRCLGCLWTAGRC